MGKQVLATLLSEGAGEIFDFAELGTSNARIPLNGRVSLTAGQRQRNRAHQVEVQAWPLALLSSPLVRHRRRHEIIFRLESVARECLD